MSKLLVVFGATGQQGGSVIDEVLDDQELSKQYKIRGIARDTSKPAARALQEKGVEIVQGNVNDIESIKQALEGADTVFFLGMVTIASWTKEKEVIEGKSIVDTAVAAGVKYIIFSTSVNAKEISGHPVDIYDTKAEVEDYVRKQPIKSAFFSPGTFMQNLQDHQKPRPTGEPGQYIIAGVPSPETRVPVIDAAGDSGKFVAAILAEPEKYEGKVLYGATKLYSYDEIAAAVSNATGKTVKYKQIPVEVFRSFLPPDVGAAMVDMFLFFQNSGYYGPETEERVKWSVQQARGKLITLEEYLEKNPIQLN